MYFLWQNSSFFHAFSFFVSCVHCGYFHPPSCLEAAPQQVLGPLRPGAHLPQGAILQLPGVKLGLLALLTWPGWAVNPEFDVASPNFKWLATIAEILKASFLSYWHVSQPRCPTYDSLCFSLLSFPRVTQRPAKMVPVGNGQWVGKGEGKRQGHGDGSYQVQLLSREAIRKFLVGALSLYQSQIAPMRPTWTTDLPIVSPYILHTREFTLHSFSVYHSMHLSIEHDVCCKLLFMDTLIRLRNYSSILNSLNSFYYKMYWISPNAFLVYIKVILWFLYFLPLI